MHHGAARALTQVLCDALMAWFGIGVKIARLQVIAPGVGVAVDCAIREGYHGRGELWKTVMINSLHVFDEVGYDIRVDNLRKSGKR